MKKKIIMCDMDGTMTHSSWRSKWAPSNGGSWDLFHARCDEDKPTPLIEFLKDVPYGIVISTARPRSVCNKTLGYLRNHQINPYIILMREKDQERVKSPLLKEGHIREMQEKHEVVAFIDDRKDVCAMAEAMGVPSILVNFEEVGVESTWNHDPKKQLSPDDVLRDVANFYEDRNKKYKDAWLHHGDIMAHNFPGGITLKTPEDFFIYHCLVMDVVKTTRICNAMADGKHHEDSWKDKIVYAAMVKSQIKE